MSKKIKPEDNSANMKNRNTGTTGTNEQYDAVQRNKSRQKDPNQKKK